MLSGPHGCVSCKRFSTS